MKRTVGKCLVLFMTLLFLCSNVSSDEGENEEEEEKEEEDDNDEKEEGVIVITDRPVVGVLSMAITDKTVHRKWRHSKNMSYIAGSYVKFLESAGARVVPISDRFNKKNLTHTFKRISGLLLPGGEVNLENSHYKSAARHLMKLAIKANQDGIFFPILGICRGAQALAVFAANDLGILEETDAKNISLPVKLTKGYEKSPMLDGIPEAVKNDMEEMKITAHFHKYGIDPKLFETNQNLKSFFRLLGVSEDRNGKKFASIFEAKRYPFYALQFHPEKPMYEWHPYKDVDHTPNAIRLSQFFANFFVSEVRKNVKHRFSNYDEEIAWNIERYPLTYSAINKKSETPFETMYML